MILGKYNVLHQAIVDIPRSSALGEREIPAQSGRWRQSAQLVNEIDKQIICRRKGIDSRWRKLYGQPRKQVSSNIKVRIVHIHINEYDLHLWIHTHEMLHMYSYVEPVWSRHYSVKDQMVVNSNGAVSGSQNPIILCPGRFLYFILDTIPLLQGVHWPNIGSDVLKISHPLLSLSAHSRLIVVFLIYQACNK